MENLARHLVDVRDTRSINRPIINTQSVRSPRRRSSTRGKETSKSTEENRSHEYSAADPLERRNITGLQVEEDRADRLNIFISVDGASSEIAISLCECSTLRLDVHTYVQVNIFILARAVNAVAHYTCLFTVPLTCSLTRGKALYRVGPKRMQYSKCGTLLAFLVDRSSYCARRTKFIYRLNCDAFFYS